MTTEQDAALRFAALAAFCALVTYAAWPEATSAAGLGCFCAVLAVGFGALEWMGRKR